MKYLLTATLLAASLLPFGSAPALAGSPSTLIKSSTDPAVYFVADGKRFAFPNADVYASWYPNFSGISTVTPTELASYALGGMVTYKPGSFLVKVVSDPTVYAVSRYGTLHALASEAMATELYGKDWTKNVRDVADSFFATYRIGAPLVSSASFDRNAEFGIPSIAENIPSSPVALTPAVVVSASTNIAVDNQQMIIRATAQHFASKPTRIDIFRDQESTPVATCTDVPICTYIATAQNTSQMKASAAEMHFRAVARDSYGTITSSAPEYQTTVTVQPVDSSITISLTPSVTSAGNSVTISSDASAVPGITTHTIFALIPGESMPVVVKRCATSPSCTGTLPLYRTTQFYSLVTTATQEKRTSAITSTMTSGVTPTPKIAMTTRPAPSQATISIQAPTGPGISITSLATGTGDDMQAIALCDQASCEVTVQLSKPMNFTALTNVTGKLEASNTLVINP